MEWDRKHLYLCDAHTRDPPTPGAASSMILAIVLLALILGAFCVALDALPFQFVGYVLYPLESALNFVFFPQAATPLRGNGSALFVLTLTLFVLGGGRFVARAIGARLRTLFKWVRR